MIRLCFAILCSATASFAQELPTLGAFEMASEAVLHDPHDLVFGPDGNLYIADKFAHRVAIM